MVWVSTRRRRLIRGHEMDVILMFVWIDTGSVGNVEGTLRARGLLGRPWQVLRCPVIGSAAVPAHCVSCSVNLTRNKIEIISAQTGLNEQAIY